MKQVEMEGESIDEAIEKALGLLGVERDKVSVDIMTEAKKGVLGFGRQNARVRVALRESVVVEALVPVTASEPTKEPAAPASGPSGDEVPVTTDEPIVTDERYAEADRHFAALGQNGDPIHTSASKPLSAHDR